MRLPTLALANPPQLSRPAARFEFACDSWRRLLPGIFTAVMRGISMKAEWPRPPNNNGRS